MKSYLIEDMKFVENPERPSFSKISSLISESDWSDIVIAQQLLILKKAKPASHKLSEKTIMSIQ
jgi:hypothetical protein